MLKLDNGKPISILDPEISQCPYQAYEKLLEEAPVYWDEIAKTYTITRYEDIRMLLKDPTLLTAEHAVEKMRAVNDPERAEKIKQIFASEGWPRARPIGNYEGAEHAERRGLLEPFLRAGKVKEYDPMLREIADSLIDKFIDDGGCDLVNQFSEHFSLLVICRLVGAPDEAIEHVRAAAAVMLRNMSMLQSEEEEIEGARVEIAAQHYFKGLIDQYRAEPNDSLLSALINSKLPSGAVMNDSEILMFVMLDLFFAGAETTAKAISSGIAMLAVDEKLAARLEADRDGNLRTFIEEVLRQEPPATTLFRIALKDIDLHGVTIPKGAWVTLRSAAANRDPRMFACPASIDLDRKNAAQHLGFGSGVHACVGAPLARRELTIAFQALLSRMTNIRLAPGEKAEYAPHIHLRGFQHLNIRFDKR
ncbi:cytochrome P450 [Sphingobium sp. JS3065]|uniref:cytochrome P450 n=1 Tax=Sphingobium sp. JS3065 TaxID=2970925 RepID=UPI002264DD6C|nr:cytochrome P450 [Sphingobium sp. JS3065]UZW56382.1 cytochrome P450 [Sphingobium sp. JS3065]